MTYWLDGCSGGRCDRHGLKEGMLHGRRGGDPILGIEGQHAVQQIDKRFVRNQVLRRQSDTHCFERRSDDEDITRSLEARLT
jgi:hypothetical protein